MKRGVVIDGYLAVRLREWARWSRSVSFANLGYPSQSAIARAGLGGFSDGKSVFLLEADHPRAEEMDSLVLELSAYDKNAAQVVRTQYLDRGTQSDKAKKMGVSLSKYKLLIRVSEAWLASRLMLVECA